MALMVMALVAYALATAIGAFSPVLKESHAILRSKRLRMKTSHLPRSRNIPSVVLIKQHCSVPKEADVREATVRELKKLFPDTTAIKGKIVGLTCPSRGIRDIAQVLITAVSFLKPHCKEVRILTAMGTHGGGPRRESGRWLPTAA
ncbi:MAG: hypothetical protein QOH96_831 [Blastocatellia bacterium]|nr:hypothetical protein [Blastocatellia bacterium]